MNNRTLWVTIASIGLVLVTLVGCGTGGDIHYHVYDPSDTEEPGPTYYYVSGTISGLNGSGLILELNDETQIQVAVDGSFGFIESPLESGTDYEVTIHQQPSTPSQQCIITNGSGTIAEANVESVEISCTNNTYRVGGLLSGMAGEGLTLSLNNTWDLVPEENGDLTFTTAYLEDGSSYEVLVSQQPEGPNQTCSVENGQGSISGSDVTSMEIRCVTNRYAVGGAVSGLTGSGLVLKMGAAQLAVDSDGPFEFSDALVEDGRLFEVTVDTQPTEPTQVCTVTDGGGMIAGGAYLDVVVDCVDELLTEPDGD